LQVLSPKGSIETSLYTQEPENSVAYATWTVPEGQAGGEYTLKMDYNEYGSMRCSPPTERKFQIRNFRSPKLNVRVEFLGRGYGPGDEVKSKVRSGTELNFGPGKKKGADQKKRGKRRWCGKDETALLCEHLSLLARRTAG
jgi:hypothetical protein